MSDDAMAAVLAALERLEQGQTATRDDLTKLRVDLMARMDRLQNCQTDMRDDTLVNHASIETFDRKVKHQEDLTRLLGEQVSLMFKRILAIDERVRTLEDKPS